MNDTIKKAASLFNKEEAKRLYDAVYEHEYVRVDFHTFNAGAYITCEYGDDLDYFLGMEGCAENGIFNTADLEKAVWKYAPEDVVNYYRELVGYE